MAFAPEHTTVWIEIPVTDLDKAMSFYHAVTGITLNRVDDMGPNPIAIFTTAGPGGVAGHLYPGKPSADGSGPTVHLASEGTLDDTMERVGKSGGQVLSPVIEIPAGKFFYAQDPDGNSIAFFKMS